MPKKRLIYIVSQINKSLAFEWTASAIREDYDLSFILLNPSSSLLEEFLVRERIPVTRIFYRGKNSFLAAFIRVLFHLLIRRPQIIHAHLFDAQLIGLTSAWLCRIDKRIYTRHTSNYHHVYRPSGIKYDRLSNWLATKVVSISQATDRVLLESEFVSPSKVVKIPHGFDWKEFQDVSNATVQLVRRKWGIPEGRPVIGVIARHIEWKGIQYIIPAFKAFLKEYPGTVIVLANASGPYHEYILGMLKELESDRVILIPFEENVNALYRVFDYYVHTPVDPWCEAFGQTYVEALAAGVPSVFTLSGIAAEFVKDHENALVVPFRNSGAIHTALCELAENKELGLRLARNGKRDVTSRFGINNMVTLLKKLYDS